MKERERLFWKRTRQALRLPGRRWFWGTAFPMPSGNFPGVCLKVVFYPPLPATARGTWLSGTLFRMDLSETSGQTTLGMRYLRYLRHQVSKCCRWLLRSHVGTLHVLGVCPGDSVSASKCVNYSLPTSGTAFAIIGIGSLSCTPAGCGHPNHWSHSGSCPGISCPGICYLTSPPSY